MPFLGKSPATPKNINVLLDAISTSGGGTTFALTKDSAAYTPSAAQSLMVSLNGVTQAPIGAYSISTSNIVFASALTSDDVIDYIIVFKGEVATLTIADVAAGDIAGSMLANSSVTTAKIQDSQVTVGKMAANSVDSAQYVDGSIDNEHLADNAVDSEELAAGAVDLAHMSATGTSDNTTFLRGDYTWVVSGGLYSAWTIQTATLGSSEAAASGDQIICNHASTAIVITLPASPSNGDTVIIKNVGAATVTVGRAGNNINSVTADATMPTGNAAQLVWTGDATIGWTVL